MDGSPAGFEGVEHLLEPAEVYQAAGMISVQLDVPIEVAGARLRAYAAAMDHSLVAVACDIVARRVRLIPLPAPRCGRRAGEVRRDGPAGAAPAA